MKKLLIILLIPVFGYSQSIEQAIKNIVDEKISSFSYTLDSVVVRSVQTTNATPVNIDTLKIPSGRSAIYQLSISAQNLSIPSDAGFGIKVVQIVNAGGVYSIANSRDDVSYGGRNTVLSTKVSWSVSIINGLPIVRVTGTTIPVLWTVKKSVL